MFKDSDVSTFLFYFPGAFTPIKHLSLRSLLPDTEHFMTYEGSTTHPGCWETTVWIILNKPIYITKHEVGWFPCFISDRQSGKCGRCINKNVQLPAIFKTRQTFGSVVCVVPSAVYFPSNAAEK